MKSLAIDHLNVADSPPTAIGVSNKHDELVQLIAANPHWLREKIKTLNRTDAKKLHQSISGSHNEQNIAQQVAKVIFDTECGCMEALTEAIKIGQSTLDMMALYALTHGYYLDGIGMQWKQLFDDLLDRATELPPPAVPVAAAPGDGMQI